MSRSQFQVAVVSVAGSVGTVAQAHEVVDRVLGEIPANGPVIVDLSRLHVEPDQLAWLVLRLEAATHWHRFRLVDDRLAHRRQLRELCRRVPVLPDVSIALAAARAEVPDDPPVLEIVDLWDGAQLPSPPAAEPVGDPVTRGARRPPGTARGWRSDG